MNPSDDEALAPEDRTTDPAILLADTFEEINTTEYTASPEMVSSIASVDLGDSPEAITVQYLAAQVYEGNMTPEEAFNDAATSGLNPDKLIFQYNQLKKHFA